MVRRNGTDDHRVQLQREICECDVLEDISISRPAKQSIRNDYWNIVDKKRD
jgi:hypothetical protein